MIMSQKKEEVSEVAFACFACGRQGLVCCVFLHVCFKKKEKRWLPLPEWSVKTHKKYSPGFRRAVFALLLVCNRLNLYKDLRLVLVGYLARCERRRTCGGFWPESWPKVEHQVYKETDKDDCVIQ